VQILLTHTPQARSQYYGAESLKGLQRLGEVVLHEALTVLDTAGLITAARNVDIIVADRATAVTAELFNAAPNLKAVVRCAVDIRNIDVVAASAVGVLVTRASPGFIDAVTELTIGLMIDLSRGVSRAVADYQASRVPQIVMGRQLSSSTVGIIGYGSIGRRVASVAYSLGMTALISDPFAEPEISHFEHVSLSELLRRSDYVVCLAVANEHTENLMGLSQFRAMQSHAYFLNLSRGNLVDEAALAQALGENWIGGAALDVGRAPDQMPSPDLARRPNVIATPHIGGLTPQAISAQSLETVEQVRTILAGDVPHGAVNAAAWIR
jgi:D-3-phosphoglycerate dehydrogenase / 2-oxoglutarate reductase